jgi:hypothetical protein
VPLGWGQRSAAAAPGAGPVITQPGPQAQGAATGTATRRCRRQPALCACLPTLDVFPPPPLQIPTFGFLYVAGYIGYVGREYIQIVKGGPLGMPLRALQTPPPLPQRSRPRCALRALLGTHPWRLVTPGVS